MSPLEWGRPVQSPGGLEGPSQCFTVGSKRIAEVPCDSTETQTLIIGGTADSIHFSLAERHVPALLSQPCRLVLLQALFSLPVARRLKGGSGDSTVLDGVT